MPDNLVFPNVVLNDGTTLTNLEASNEGFYFCNQELNYFPPVPEEIKGTDKWMTESQEQLTTVYGWTVVAFLVLYIVMVLGRRIILTAISFVRGVYEPSGYNQHKDFSSGIGLETFGYIPQLEVPGFHFPLLACNIDDIDVKLIGWKDPNCGDENEGDEHRNYDSHNLIFDVPHAETLHRSRHEATQVKSIPHGGKKGRPIFSIVKQYPPEWVQRARENSQT